MISVASSVVGGPVKVGDRVIVSSQTAGTKTGTLRYLGPTDFAGLINVAIFFVCIL